MLKGDEVKMYEAATLEDCQYWYNRRVEKDWRIADEAYRIDSDNTSLPVDKWHKELLKSRERLDKRAKEESERAELERLKKKYD